MFAKENAIDLHNVSVFRAGHHILTNINWQVEKGQCCAIIGPNGSGKSTLIAVTAGYVWPSAGTVTVFGQKYGTVSLTGVRQKIGLIEPSRMPKFNDSMPLRNIVATGLFGTVLLSPAKRIAPKDWKKIDAEISLLGLQNLADAAFGQLSTGEQMKTLIARAMVSEAGLLILDEPTIGLDIGARATVVQALDKLLSRKNPPTLVIVSHHLDELPTCVHQVLLLKNGTVLVKGSPERVLTSRNLSRAFDCNVNVSRNGRRYISCVL